MQLSGAAVKSFCSSTGSSLLVCLAALALAGCPDDPEPAAPDAGDTDTQQTDAADDVDTGDASNTDAADVINVDPDAFAYRTEALTHLRAHHIDRLPFEEPVFAIFAGFLDKDLEVVVHDSATHTTSTHSIEIRDGVDDEWEAHVVWSDEASGKFAVQIHHRDFTLDFLLWQPSEKSFETIVSGVRNRFAASHWKNEFPSGYAYTYDSEAEELLVLNLRRGTIVRRISEHERGNPFHMEAQTGRVIFNYRPGHSDYELFAYDPQSDELTSLGSVMQTTYDFLDSGRVVYTSPTDGSQYPVKLWEFGQRSSRTVWSDSAYRYQIHDGDRPLIVFVGSDLDTSYTTISVYDDVTGEHLYTDSHVDHKYVRVNPQGTLIVYPRYVSSESSGGQGEVVAHALDTGETFVLSEFTGTLRSFAPTFAPSGKAVAAGGVLWSNDAPTPRKIENPDGKYFPSPSGHFWTYSQFDVDLYPDRILSAWDLTTDEQFVYATDPDVYQGINQNSPHIWTCAPTVTGGGAQVVAKFELNTDLDSHQVVLWRRSDGQMERLVGQPASNLACPSYIDENGDGRGLVASTASEGRLVAWEGDQVTIVEDSRSVGDFVKSSTLDDFYYWSYPVGSGAFDADLRRWNFSTGESEVIGANVDEEEYRLHDGLVAFLEKPESCTNGCDKSLVLYRPDKPEAPLVVHERATELREILGRHVFFRGADDSPVPIMKLSIAYPLNESN